VPIRSVLLLSGPLAVGKTAVRDQLAQRFDFAPVRSSQYLRARADERQLSIARESLQELGDALDTETDYRWVIDSVAMPAMAQNPSQSLWLVDAVRKPRQIHHFRKQFGAAVFHAHLFADEEILRARYVSRQSMQGESADPTPYEEAINHENERSARSLIDLADLALDVGALSPAEAAKRVFEALRKKFGGSS
jgi:cytidylate kinase